MARTYGYELLMDLDRCNRATIKSPQKLREYVDKLCQLIRMKKYGKTLLAYFGKKTVYAKGYSLVQLIETSSITGHFSDLWGTAYINIFSCKKFDPRAAKKFTCSFFDAKMMKSRFFAR